MSLKTQSRLFTFKYAYYDVDEIINKNEFVMNK